jgi:hypothetical protein
MRRFLIGICFMVVASFGFAAQCQAETNVVDAYPTTKLEITRVEAYRFKVTYQNTFGSKAIADSDNTISALGSDRLERRLPRLQRRSGYNRFNSGM